MDKHSILELLNVILNEVKLAILRKEDVYYNEGYQKVVSETINMIETNQNIVTILDNIKEYHKDGELHPLSLFSNGEIDASNEIIGIIYDYIGKDNYDE